MGFGRVVDRGDDDRGMFRVPGVGDVRGGKSLTPSFSHPTRSERSGAQNSRSGRGGQVNFIQRMMTNGLWNGHLPGDGRMDAFGDRDIILRCQPGGEKGEQKRKILV
jgi:hypothetical protein